MEDTDGTRAASERRLKALALRDLAQAEIGSGRTVRSPELEAALHLFGSERDLVLAVHQRWQVNLLARLDQALECGTDDLHRDVRRAVDELTRALPGFAALLRRHADDPALARARQRLTAYVEQACTCGRRHPLVAPAPRARVKTCAVLRVGATAARWTRLVVRLAVDGCPHAERSGRRPTGARSTVVLPHVA
jgi:AcrR family transcriptional regulator